MKTSSSSFIWAQKCFWSVLKPQNQQRGWCYSPTVTRTSISSFAPQLE